MEELLNQSHDEGCYGILWHALYRPDGIRTEAKIIDEGFALLLAEELSRHYPTEAEAIRRQLQSWVDFRILSQTFCLCIDISRSDHGNQVVKKCEEETRIMERMLLKHYESLLGENGVNDQIIGRLWTDLFLDLCIGQELDLVVNEQGTFNEHKQPARSRLVWWTRIDEQYAKITLRVAAEADQNHVSCLTINITGDLISKLGSQGIFFPTVTLAAIYSC
jgi:hypothetical protein